MITFNLETDFEFVSFGMQQQGVVSYTATTLAEEGDNQFRVVVSAIRRRESSKDVS